MRESREPKLITETQWRRSYVTSVWRWTWIVLVLSLVIGILITLSALLDVTLELGWGYHGSDVLVGIGLLAGGGLVYLCTRAIAQAMGATH